MAASTVPSPPSATGRQRMATWFSTRRRPVATLCATWLAVSEPLNLSGAIRMLIELGLRADILIQQHQSRWCVIGTAGQILKLLDIVQRCTHRDVGNPLEYNFNDNRHLVFIHKRSCLLERGAKLFWIINAKCFAPESLRNVDVILSVTGVAGFVIFGRSVDIFKGQ